MRHGVDYFGAWNGRLYALDLRTRRLRWTRSLGAKITSSAAIAGGRLFIGDYGGRLWALSPRTGATRWVALGERPRLRHAGGRGRPRLRPVLDRRLADGVLGRGRYLWRVGTGAYVYSSPAAWGGRVFFGSYNGVFYGVSAASGRVLWAVGTGGPISGAAVVVDGVAYAGSFAHRIVGVDARSGRVLLRFGHGHYVPGVRKRDALTFSRLLTSLCSGAAFRETSTAIHRKRHLRHDAQMRRAAAGVAAVLALAVPAVAQASTTHDAALARKGITHAVQRHWVKPADALRYRTAVTRALRDIKTLPKLRGDVIASQLSQMTPLWDSYTSPRALALFTQLETNLDYLETHRLPTVRVDVTDDDGVVYRWFPRLGLEFHPLANFGALNNAAATGDVDATRTLADALVARAIPRDRRLLWEYQFRFARRPPAVGVRHGAGRRRAGARARVGAAPGSDARRGRGARVRIGAAVPALAAERPVDPPLRLQRPGRAERAAAGDPLAARVRADDRRTPARRRSRSGCDDGAGALPALRHRRLVALPARRRLRDARVPEVRHRPAREARPPDAGPVLDRRRRSASTPTTTTRRR